jgi:hypothetical protein
MSKITKYTFSGHESFPCKSLWLKKGYDFVKDHENWNSADSVVKLGVGKNMVSSIRYWMRAFGLLESEELTDIANYIFDKDSGRDPFIEDLGTLWLLHYLLVSSGEAALYNLLFTRFQRERIVFSRSQLVAFVKRIMTEDGKLKTYNENTVTKDVGVLLQNYVHPQNPQSLEDYAALLIDLDLINVLDEEKQSPSTTDRKQYTINTEGKRQLPLDILLFAIANEKGKDKSVDYDTLQNIGSMFCLSDMELISMLLSLQTKYPDKLRYSDTAGIRQVQFLTPLSPTQVLTYYYDEKI